MKFLDIFRMCIRNLTKRKMRTFLTVSGVVIGTCAIIVMISLGTGMTAAQKQMISEWADLTLIHVNNWNGGGGGGMSVHMGGSSSGSSDPNKKQPEDITDKVVAKFKEIPHVKAVTPFYSQFQVGSQIAIYSDNLSLNWAPFIGVYMDELENFGYKIKEGRFANKKDPKGTVLFGVNTLANLIDYTLPVDDIDRWIQPIYDENWNIVSTALDPMTDTFSIIPLSVDPENPWGDADYSIIGSPTAINMSYNEDLNVVGTIEGNMNDYQISQGVLIDINYMKELIKAYNDCNPDYPMEEFKDNYRDVRIRVDDMDYVQQVEDELKAMGYQTYSDNQARENMKQQTQMIQMILGALAAVSLFVAALNITNTMVMSIIERTKEIGIMKVLGCDVSKIRLLFLGEAASIGFIGGVVGIGLSYLVSFLLNTFLTEQLMQLLGGGQDTGVMLPPGTNISVIEPWLLLAALAFATVVGLVSGFYPANRSVKISALSAITHE